MEERVRGVVALPVTSKTSLVSFSTGLFDTKTKMEPEQLFAVVL